MDGAHSPGSSGALSRVNAALIVQPRDLYAVSDEPFTKERTDMAEAAWNEDREPRVVFNLKELVNAGINVLLQTGQSARAALKRPTIRATVGGAIVTAAALTVGIVPTVVGCTAGYISYRLFREQQRHQAEELR